jgi:predicted hotdog family 3-hydroxylacyl-ACP dehydratase
MSRAGSDASGIGSGSEPALEVIGECREDDRFEQQLRVPTDLACLEGHFPGLPVLPGLAQLEWAVRAAGLLTGAPVRVHGIEALKFRELIRPGESFTAQLKLSAEGQRADLEVLRDGRVAASARLRLGDLQDGEPAVAAAFREDGEPDGEDARPLVPHAEPMVFLDRLLTSDEKQTRCSVRVEAIPMFRDPRGGLPGWVGLEPMAQCIAAHGGLEARRRGHAPRIGFLLGCRRLRVDTDRLRPGVGYAVSATQVWGADEGLVSFDCELFERAGGLRLLAGRINAYLPADASAIVEGRLEAD